MNAIRIIVMLAIGVLWVLYGPANFILRYGSLLLLMVTVYWITRLIFGKAVADSDPLAAEPVPSLSLAERQLSEQRDR